MRHRHQWTEVSRTFNAPNNALKSATGIRADDMAMLLYGFTVIELHCEECGDVTHSIVTGRTT